VTAVRTALGGLRFDNRPVRVAGWLLAVVLALFFVLPFATGVSAENAMVRATPFILTGLATAIPARAGLVNVGGEGQLLLGSIFATWGALHIAEPLPTAVALPLLAVLGAIGGLLWAGIAGVLRMAAGVNETISTLLLNFVASLFVSYLVFGPLRDPASYNLPMTRDFVDSARLPMLGTSQLHVGAAVAVLAAIVCWVVLDKTRAGFRLRVLAGNPEAARRAGMSVARLGLVSLLAGGAVAGIAGMVEVTGIEGRLRPDLAVGFGYIGFLGSWLVGHRPLAIIGAGLLLGAISVGGDSLQIDLGLPSTSVYVVMALVLLGVLAVRGQGRGSR
jgi:ABC-type uncharacterized transport system permease subunit